MLITRGATPLRLSSGKKKPACDATGNVSQPHSIRTRRIACDALCHDNGGYSGPGYSASFKPSLEELPFTLQLRGPFDFDVRPGFPLLPVHCAA